MADIILNPIAELIVDTLGSAAVEEIRSVYGASGELSKLESTLSTIRSVLVDAEKRQIREEQVRDWLEKLEDVFFDADDVVDGVNADGLRRKLMPTGNKLVKKVRTFFSSDNQLVFRHKLASRIKDIGERLQAISADKERFHFVKLPEEIPPARRVRADSYSFVVQENVVGRDKDKKAIVELLLNPDNRAHQEKVSVIPIVGMGGLGKTTLAQLVFNDEKVQQHFELKIWVCVSNDFSVKVLCEKIIKTITDDERVENHEMEHLQRKLRQLITEKRYLLVLDDVWIGEGRKWKELKDLLTENCSKGSRIIVTTRLHTVANVMSTMQPYDLGILDSEDSWNLFKKMADHEGKELSDQNMDIAEGILAKCAGLPLAISMIGSMLLSSRNPEIEWPSFLKKELSNIPQGENGILPTLRLSFDVLPSHLKACFAYCSLFPKDHEFDVQTLITLWLAQGFIRSDQSQSPEETGYEYFEDLLWRSFFQEAKKDEALNMVKKCKMHDLVHDLAIQVAGEKYAMLASCEDNNLRKSVCHISFDVSSTYSFKEIPSSWLQGHRIRSFLFPSNSYEIGDSKLDEDISNLKFLRTLDLSDGGIETVPDSVGKLKHLRYLDLSENRIKTLPASITKLVNLQTLKLNWCNWLCELPHDIEKLVNLRHLELKGCDRVTHMPRGLSQLTNLQTISLVVLSENVPNGPYSKLDELMGMENLSGEVKIKGIISGMVTMTSKLRENNRLRSLHLNFERREDDASKWKTTLEGLQPHPNLKELSLDQYGGYSLSGFLPTLTNLVKLFLENCSKCQQLPSLDKFHSLKEMSLNTLPFLEYITINEGDNYFSTSSSQSVSVLPSLQTLSLIKLPNFRGWWRSGMTENQVEQLILPSFPRLSSLTIEGCEKLTSMPRYPNIEGELELRYNSWKTFEQTSKAEETSASTIPRIVLVSSYPLSKLTYLRLSNVTDVEYFPDERMKGLASLKSLDIRDCPALKCLSPWILYLTSLEALGIIDCEEFEGIKWPETPTLTRLRIQRLNGLPKLKNLLPPSIQHLTSLEALEIEGCEGLEEIKLTTALTCLRVLKLKRLPKLKYVFAPDMQCLTSLEDLVISSCEGLEEIKLTPALTRLRVLQLFELPKLKHLSSPGVQQHLTSLEELLISSCKGLEEIKLTPDLPRLRVLNLWELPKLKHLSSPGVQQHLTSLEELGIIDCEELQVSNDDSIEWQSLTTLRFLDFTRLPQLVSLPVGLQFLTTLKRLQILICPNFTGLPDWICKLSSLETLCIWGCPKFKSVPASVSSLTSLQNLEINGKDMNPREIHEDLDLSSSASGSSSWKISKKLRVLGLCNK